MTLNVLIPAALGYVVFLFVIASGLLHRRLGRPLPTEAPKDEL